MDLKNRYTGEILPFKTITNVEPHPGVNKEPGEDLCRLEDFEPIGAVIARFLRTETDISKEYAFTNPTEESLDEERVYDVFDNEDILDRQIELEEFGDRIDFGAVVDNSSTVAVNTKTTERPGDNSEQGETNVVSADEQANV